MTASVRFGTDHQLELDLPEDRLIARCGVPSAAPLADVRQATGRALGQPLGFPPLAQAVVPGDRVVLALGRDVPDAASIVAGLFDCLVGRGVTPSDITLLAANAAGATVEAAKALLPAEYRDAAAVVRHDPDDRKQLSYLAVASDDEPIYLNRLLCDADIVVPIGCLRCQPALDYHGLYGGLFPTFAGRVTQGKPKGAGAKVAGRPAGKRDRTQEVGWLLGVQFVVQVVPGTQGQVGSVLAGAPHDVASAGQAQCQQLWASRVPHPAQLVVAAIDGPAAEQTWDNLARALAAALRVVSAGGAIALCSELSTLPGPTVRQAVEAREDEAILRQLRRQKADDSLPALALAEALGQARIYLASQLEDSVVEELGMIPLASPAELRRLAARHASCIVLSNAQFAVPTIADE